MRIEMLSCHDEHWLILKLRIYAPGAFSNIRGLAFLFFFFLGLAIQPCLAQGPVNDTFRNRLEIAMPFYHFEGLISGATNEAGEPLPDPTFKQTLWWKFVPHETGLIRLSFAGGFSPKLSVYDGT